jgi:hypothetical protein
MIKGKQNASRLVVAFITMFVVSDLARAQDDSLWEWGRATIVGGPSGLEMFDAALKHVMGVTDLEMNQIGCEGCEKLADEDKPPTQLVYIFPRQRHDIYSMFMEAWNATQSSSGNQAMTIEFKGVHDERTVCPEPPPPGCKNMSYCPYDQCGKYPPVPGGCGLCPP